VHKSTILLTLQEDPFSQVCSKLARELKAQSDQVLLSHRTVTVKPSESPASLGLTTADIIGELLDAHGSCEITLRALQASQYPDYKCPFPVPSILARPSLFILRHSCLVNNWALFIVISALRFLPDNRCCDSCHSNACKTTSNLLLEEDFGNEEQAI